MRAVEHELPLVVGLQLGLVVRRRPTPSCARRRTGPRGSRPRRSGTRAGGPPCAPPAAWRPRAGAGPSAPPTRPGRRPPPGAGRSAAPARRGAAPRSGAGPAGPPAPGPARAPAPAWRRSRACPGTRRGQARVPNASSIPRCQRAVSPGPWHVVRRRGPEAVGEPLVGACALAHLLGRAGRGEGVGHVLADGVGEPVGVAGQEGPPDRAQPAAEAVAGEELLVGPDRGVEAHRPGRRAPCGGRVVVRDGADQGGRQLGRRPPRPLGPGLERRHQPLGEPRGRGDGVVEEAVGDLAGQPGHPGQDRRQPDRRERPRGGVGAAKPADVDVVERPGRRARRGPRPGRPSARARPPPARACAAPAGRSRRACQLAFRRRTPAPSPRVKRPPDSSSRSSASSATTIGLRVKARAMPVPRPMRSVAAAAIASGTVAERCSSGAHRRASPARSASAANRGDLGRVVAEQLAVDRDRERGRHGVRVSQPVRPIARLGTELLVSGVGQVVIGAAGAAGRAAADRRARAGAGGVRGRLRRAGRRQRVHLALDAGGRARATPPPTRASSRPHRPCAEPPWRSRSPSSSRASPPPSVAASAAVLGGLVAGVGAVDLVNRRWVR